MYTVATRCAKSLAVATPIPLLPLSQGRLSVKLRVHIAAFLVGFESRAVGLVFRPRRGPLQLPSHTAPDETILIVLPVGRGLAGSPQRQKSADGLADGDQGSEKQNRAGTRRGNSIRGERDYVETQWKDWPPGSV